MKQSRHDLFLVSCCQNEQELNDHDQNFQLKVIWTAGKVNIAVGTKDIW